MDKKAVDAISLDCSELQWKDCMLSKQAKETQS